MNLKGDDNNYITIYYYKVKMSDNFNMIYFLFIYRNKKKGFEKISGKIKICSMISNENEKRN